VRSEGDSILIHETIVSTYQKRGKKKKKKKKEKGPGTVPDPSTGSPPVTGTM
jgi:hypothetical protein